MTEFIIVSSHTSDQPRFTLPVPEAHCDDTPDVIDRHLQVVWDIVWLNDGRIGFVARYMQIPTGRERSEMRLLSFFGHC